MGGRFESADEGATAGEHPWPVAALKSAGIEVIEYVEGSDDNQPLVRFSGGRGEGWRALAAAMEAGLVVGELRKVWQVSGGEPIGPWWELTFQAISEPAQTNDNKGEPESAKPGERSRWAWR